MSEPRAPGGEEPPDGTGHGPLDFAPDARDLAGGAGEPRRAVGGPGDEEARRGDAPGDENGPDGPPSGPATTGAGPGTTPSAEDGPGGRAAPRRAPWGPRGRRTGVRLGDERSMAPGNRWLLAVVLLLVVATVGILASSRNDGSGGGPEGGGLRAGRALPAFAAPIATGPVMGDVNVATRADQGAAGAVPACAVRRAGVLVSCRLAEGGPAALLLTSEGSKRCVRAVGQLERLAARAGVSAATVIEGGDRDRTARLVRASGWRMPVAHDRDNALASLFGAPICPFVVLIGADGRIAGTLPGLLDDARLGDALQRLGRTRGEATG